MDSYTSCLQCCRHRFNDFRWQSVYRLCSHQIRSSNSDHIKGKKLSPSCVRFLSIPFKQRCFYLSIYLRISSSSSSSSSSCRSGSTDIPTLSRNFSLSFIATSRSSGLHPVSSHSCWMYVRARRPAFAWPYVGSIRVHHLWFRPCLSSSVLHVWLNSFRDRRHVAVQLVSCGLLPPRLVQDCSQHSCVIAVKLLLQPFC